LKGGFLQLKVKPPYEGFPAHFKIDSSSNKFGDDESRLAYIIRRFEKSAQEDEAKQFVLENIKDMKDV
jgi:hypothetical protein